MSKIFLTFTNLVRNNLAKGFLVYSFVFMGFTNQVFALPQVDCTSAMVNAFHLSQNKELKLTQGKNDEDLSCEMSLKFFETNSGLTNKKYRQLNLTPATVFRYPDGSLTEMIVLYEARLADNENGLMKYQIEQCEVSNEKISLRYSSRELFGWHRKDDFSFIFLLQDGKVKSIESRNGDATPLVCYF